MVKDTKYYDLLGVRNMIAGKDETCLTYHRFQRTLRTLS